MNLCIDIGNSMVKTAVFSGEIMQGSTGSENIGTTELAEIKSEYPQIKNVILCSVRREDPELNDLLRSFFPNLHFFNEFTRIPLEILYRTGKTLGRDRLAAVTGANNIYPGRNVLVVDLGTAITYDLVDEYDRYVGGNISPGMSLRFRALHEFTERLPLVGPKKRTSIISETTELAIASGVQKGIVFELGSYISCLKKQYKGLKIIFTGGDAKYFVKKLKSTIFVDPFLVFKGLNRILSYNAENN